METSELTRRMLKGVVADAAFHFYVVPELGQHGWKDIPLATNEAYDHMLADRGGEVTIQVKLQRSELGKPVIKRAGHFIVEVQKTRTGKKKVKGEPNGDGEVSAEVVDTRPYAYGDFQILAVSLWPSTKDWKRFRYTVAEWLVPRPGSPNLIAVMQPVAAAPNNVWTDDFTQAVAWLRDHKNVSPVKTAAPQASQATGSRDVDLFKTLGV